MAGRATSRADEVVAWAPGRVNLMGDHTDQTGGRVLPMAIDLGTTVRGRRGGDRIRLRSAWAGPHDVVEIRLGDRLPPELGWGRLVAAVAERVGPEVGLDGTVESTVPIGAGLSSSAALELAVALALGFDGSARELAELGRAAEHAATGVPCGIMDQLASAGGVAGHALRIDCHDQSVEPVPMPADLEVVVVHSGQERALSATPYAQRVADLLAAEAVIGPLRAAAVADLAGLEDPVLRRRARHVVTENERVDRFADALRAGDRPALAALLSESHASLRDDLEVSTAAVEELVATLTAVPGVLGARITGAGFGGCVVTLVEPGTALPDRWRSWSVTAADGATSGAAGPPSWPRTRRR